MTTIQISKDNKSLELAFESIDSCFGYIDHIISHIQKLIVHYNAGESELTNNGFTEIVDLMDLYIQLVTKIYRVIRVETGGQSYKNVEFQKLEIHLLSVVRSLLQAKEKNDSIMICDLLEYELIDNLKQWKIQLKSCQN